MKKRNNFVSNSSSTSFIVTSDEPAEKVNITKFKSKLKKLMETHPNGNLSLPSYDIGVTEFGWDFKEYRSLGDKLNFVVLLALQAYHHKKDIHPLCNIKKFLNEFLVIDSGKIKFKNVMEFALENYYSGMYIDHQSGYAESDANRKFVDDYEKLKNFMLTKSYIDGGNDNDPRY